MDEHEVYPNPPVVLVALEVRHPTSEPLTSSEERAIKSHLGARLPIARTAQLASFQMVAGSLVAPTPNVETFIRYMDRKSTVAVSFRRDAMTVEASVYPGWDEFQVIIAEAIDARMRVAPVDGVERIGVRYIDEIRVPSDGGEPTWGDWVSSSLLPPKPSEPVDLQLTQWQGVAVYGGQPGHTLILRYGPMTGFAVDPSSELRRGKPADGGKYFLMDIDSFWTPDGSVPELDRDNVLRTCNDLHRPVRSLFEGLIQPKLRDEVFRSHESDAATGL